MTIQIGDRRRFHNDGREPGVPHTITQIEADRVHYVYDGQQVPVWWPVRDDETAGGYEECTEEAP